MLPSLFNFCVFYSLSFASIAATQKMMKSEKKKRNDRKINCSLQLASSIKIPMMLLSIVLLVRVFVPCPIGLAPVLSSHLRPLLPTSHIAESHNGCTIEGQSRAEIMEGEGGTSFRWQCNN